MMEKKLPEGWEWKRLGDLITYKKGRKPDILLEQKDEGGLPYLTAGYFRTGTPKNFVPLDYHSSCVRCDLNDIVLIWDGSNAGDVFKGLTGVLASTMIKIEPKVQQFLPNFAFLFLKTQFQTLKSRTTGSSIPHISKSVFENLKVPLPPLETQRKIVAILEKADETKRLRMQADELTNQLLQSVFLEMFGDPVKNPKGWEVKTLGDICTLIKDGPHVSPNYVEEGVPFITVHNIIKGFFDLCNVKYISKEDHTEFCKRCKPERGDVLYSKGGTTGFAKRVDVEFEFSIWVHLALLKFPKDRINPIFLETCLNSNYCKVQAKRYTRGIANRDLVLGQMAKIKIIVPPLSIQQKFAQIIEKVEAMQQNQKQSRQEINNLFNALMQKAFKGELVA